MKTTPQTSSTSSQTEPGGRTVSARGAPAPSPVLRNVQKIADLDAKSSAHRSALDRLSDRVSDFASSTSFLLIHVVWFAGWVALNTLAPNAVDPYPFTFLTFLVSLEAIFLTSFVLISQNHLEAQAHRRQGELPGPTHHGTNVTACATCVRLMRGNSIRSKEAAGATGGLDCDRSKGA